MEFAFVTFVNSHPTYVQLMKSTIRSVELFSKYPIIVYCVDFPELFMPFIASDKCILRRISIQSVCGKSIYYVKPFIILDAIKQGLTSGYYIEADDIVTPSCDFIVTYLSKVDTFPISPIHPNDVIISKHFMNNLGVTTKTQHYIHAHVLFKSSNKDFIEEWLQGCLRSRGENWDESVLNCMYWKHGLAEHCLPVIDPWYQAFDTNPDIINTAITLHGCKQPHEHASYLERMRLLASDKLE